MKLPIPQHTTTLLAPLSLIALMTWYIWFNSTGELQITNRPDGSNRIFIGPTPLPTPMPKNWSHPIIDRAATPAPGTVKLPLAR